MSGTISRNDEKSREVKIAGLKIAKNVLECALRMKLAENFRNAWNAMSF